MYTNANFASIGTGHACTLLKLSMHKKTDSNWFQNLKQLYYHLHTYYLKQCYKTSNQGQNPDSILRLGEKFYILNFLPQSEFVCFFRFINLIRFSATYVYPFFLTVNTCTTRQFEARGLTRNTERCILILCMCKTFQN